jgi:hypothetical protein
MWTQWLDIATAEIYGDRAGDLQSDKSRQFGMQQSHAPIVPQ